MFIYFIIYLHKNTDCIFKPAHPSTGPKPGWIGRVESGRASVHKTACQNLYDIRPTEKRRLIGNSDLE